jgi:hypothetical protein
MLDGLDQWLWPQLTPKPYYRVDAAAADAWRAMHQIVEFQRIESGRNYYFRGPTSDAETTQCLERYQYALKIENNLKSAVSSQCETASYSFGHLGPSENRWRRVARSWLMQCERNARLLLIVQARNRTAPFAKALWNELERDLRRSRRLMPRSPRSKPAAERSQ